MPSPLQAQDIAHLVEPDRSHRRVYTDPAVFDLEMKTIFGKAWNFVGHESQVPKPGDFYTTKLMGQPVVMVRQPDLSIQVIHNRCGHRGAKVVVAEYGNARHFNCIYHGWSFNTDGSLAFIPLEDGYENTYVKKCDPQFGMTKVAAVDSYQGFVFAKLTTEGPDLRSFLGGITQPLDHLTNLSPEGTLTLSGGSFRAIFPCNWKIYLENIHDGVHPRFVHRSSVDASQHISSQLSADNKEEPFALGLVKANGQNYKAMDDLEVRVFPHGHSDMRGFRNPVNDDSVFKRYTDLLEKRHGEQQAKEILARNWHNFCVYPNLSIHPGFPQLRKLTPLSVNETMVEIWNLRLDGAPEELFHRTITYANTVHSPSSIIKPDDLEAYMRVQHGLASEGADWVSNHRRSGNETTGEGFSSDSALSEHFIRNQYKAWSAYMTQESDA
jgi:phenylpropionate dioxygenase-like ring-hydroxylating dioxygenase large terminal subunit